MRTTQLGLPVVAPPITCGARRAAWWLTSRRLQPTSQLIISTKSYLVFYAIFLITFIVFVLILVMCTSLRNSDTARVSRTSSPSEYFIFMTMSDMRKLQLTIIDSEIIDKSAKGECWKVHPLAALLGGLVGADAHAGPVGRGGGVGPRVSVLH